MLRKYDGLSAFAIIFILLFTLWTGFRLGKKPDAHQHLPDELTADQIAHRTLETQIEISRWAFPMFMMTLLGVVLVFATWGSARRANNLFAQSSQQQLRAYVTISELEFEDEHSTITGIKRKNSNSGNSIALEVDGWIAFASYAPGEQRFERPQKNVMNLRQRNIEANTADEDTIPFTTPTTYADLNFGNKTSYVWGEIFYKDIFGDTHVTKFRYHAKKDENEIFFLSACDEGNEVR